MKFTFLLIFVALLFISCNTPINPDIIKPTIVVLYPNGGDTLVVGTDTIIRWIASDNDEVVSVVVLFSTNDGNTWDTIETENVNIGSMNWKVPNMISDNCLIKLIAIDASENTQSDKSDEVFTIIDSNTTVSKEAERISISLTFDGPEFTGNGYNEFVAPLIKTNCAVWIEDSTGNFIKTITVTEGVPYVGEHGHHLRALPKWAEVSATVISNEADTGMPKEFDGITSASIAFADIDGDTTLTFEWDFTNSIGELVEKGKYSFWAEVSNLDKVLDSTTYDTIAIDSIYDRKDTLDVTSAIKLSLNFDGPEFTGDGYSAYVGTLVKTNWAVWIEDTSGNFIKTITVSQGVPYVGEHGHHLRALPRWAEASATIIPDTADTGMPEVFDGITSASIAFSEIDDTTITMLWDFTDSVGDTVKTGVYTFWTEISNLNKVIDSITYDTITVDSIDTITHTTETYLSQFTKGLFSIYRDSDDITITKISAAATTDNILALTGAIAFETFVKTVTDSTIDTIAEIKHYTEKYFNQYVNGTVTYSGGAVTEADLSVTDNILGLTGEVKFKKKN